MYSQALFQSHLGFMQDKNHNPYHPRKIGILHLDKNNPIKLFKHIDLLYSSLPKSFPINQIFYVKYQLQMYKALNQGYLSFYYKIDEILKVYTKSGGDVLPYISYPPLGVCYYKHPPPYENLRKRQRVGI